jgi:ABC-2 type transport system ATP-binding protein
MVEELGLEPEPRLNRLEQAILLADPALDLTEREAGPAPWVPQANGHLAVEVDRLSRRFGGLIGVENVSFAARPGEVVGLLGPAGAGKTTIIRLLSTLLVPTGGSFSIAGVPSSRAVEIRRLVGVLPAGARSPGQMTGREFLCYHARLFGLGRDAARELADRLLAELDLTGQAAVPTRCYDQDRCRRLELARALVNDPVVVLLDEPTEGLDPVGRRRILDLVRDTAKQRGATVVLATHDLAEVERICGSVLVMDKGAAIASGRLGEVAGEFAAVATNGGWVPR